MKYTSSGLKRRGDTDKWCVTLSHKDPLTGELVSSYHTVTARTEKQAVKRCDVSSSSIPSARAAPTPRSLRPVFGYLEGVEEG